MSDKWLRFAAHQPKRKRAEAVCFFCHSKKIKCDLQGRRTQGETRCTNCEGQDQDCHLRPSRRGKTRQRVIAQTQDENEAQFDPLATIAPGNDLSNQAMVPTPSSIRASQPGIPDTVVSTEDPPGPSSYQGTQPSASPTEGGGRSHGGDVDIGFLQVYGPENQLDAEQQELLASLDMDNPSSDPRQQELQQSFSETYFRYCYPWCPVLDRDTLEADLKRSPMLANALALAASHVQPPLVKHEGPAEYYQKARMIFYNDEEADMLTALKAISLFYWWAPRPPSIAHRHSSWWWTSVIIRHAQQMNIHREPTEEVAQAAGIDLGLRRRLWWTVFARERLTSLCQSKPCIICPEDMNIREPQPEDFPSDATSQKKGRIFLYWVRLCAIIGRVSKVLSQSPSAPFPADLRQELVNWVQTLPPDLQLSIGSSRTVSFDRDVYQLHLPYLTTVIIIHLRRTAPDLPQALPPAILAASCIARILRDILSRGNARFLMAITCWYCGTAFIALLQASRIKQFSQEAEEGLDILEQAVGQLQKMWASANVIRQGFERLRSLPRTMIQSGRPKPATAHGDDLSDEFNWILLFPFVTRSTSRIADHLIADKELGTTVTALPSPENGVFHHDLLEGYQDLLEPFVDYTFDFSTLGFETL
ncbi:hypothetical protein BHE90_003703 [Fusarium euwallaceae]|uniref:Zn(2)-C6 fungal-type domain-containing protein n=3 Tax=Fusarium solani species complex TaxID=232080 RepID=A0A3M2SNM5_9HYPO|nr:hypothetical protein CDV36_001160 [Fusarium kuroshium]RSL82675.1 hypothetical protein CEP51_004993 [Fusarium floridanum]RTE81784.1 hypothetical protein BHE90_003703 [Fusarium euwallaceae]